MNSKIVNTENRDVETTRPATATSDVTVDELGVDVGAKKDLPWGQANDPDKLSPYIRFDGKYPAHWPAWVQVPVNSYFNSQFYPTGSLPELGAGEDKFLALFFIQATEEDVLAAYDSVIPAGYEQADPKTRPAKDESSETSATYSWTNEAGQRFVLQVLYRPDYGDWVRVGLNVPAEK